MRSLLLVLSLCAPLTAQLGSYGYACNTTSLIPTLSITGTPKLGNTFTLDASWLHPAPFVTFLIGVSRTTWGSLSLPFNLAAVGRPDCNVLASGELMIDWPSTSWTGAVLPVPVPNDPRVTGLTLFAQAFDWAWGPGLAMTNGYAFRIVP